MLIEFGDTNGLRAASHGHIEFYPSEHYQITALMECYLAGSCTLQDLLTSLNMMSEDGRKFHFNLNTDIQRLLIVKHPHKLTFSGPKDLLERSRHPQDKRLIIDTLVNMAKDHEYEYKQLDKAKKDLAKKIGGKKLIGTYGQLSFTDEESKAKANALVARFLTGYSSADFAILQSGSLLGVSNISHEFATERGFQTIGIVPKSISHLVDRNKFTDIIIEGDDWGEASFLFGALPVEILFAGGGYWSFLEYKKALEYGTHVNFGAFSGVRYVEEFNDGMPKNIVF